MDTKEIISTEHIEIRLNAIVANASSLSERISCGAFAFENTSLLNPEEIEMSWAQAIGLKSTEKLHEWLGFMGWSRADFQKALQSNARVTDSLLLPEWAILLKKIFKELRQFCPREQLTSHGKEKEDINYILFPFIKMAEEHVISESKRLNIGITFTSGREMVLSLSKRLVTLTVAVLDSDIYTSSIMSAIGISRKAEDLAGYEAWISRIERYPVLGRLIAVSYYNWANGITELLCRLSNDSEFIAKNLFAGSPVELLVDYSGDAGDVHCNGRSVALLTFSGGRKLVYKPKNLEIANTFFSLIDLLNQKLSTPLARRKICVMGEYSWEEFIEHQECAAPSEFPVFFKRLGMLTRLFQLLGARDFWLDNLIAHGDQPTFIDLEMVIQHLKEIDMGLLSSEKMALAELEESIVKIGIVSFRTPIGLGVKAEDLAALAPIKILSSPFKLALSSDQVVLPGLTRSDDGYIQWEKKDYLPSCKGVFAKPAQHLNSFLAGYGEMNQVLLQLKDNLLNKNSILYQFAEALLRYIHRDTWTYMRIIKISTHPQLMTNGMIREKSLISLFREVWQNDTIDSSKATIVAAEIQSMTNLDIPLFNAAGDTRDLPVDNTSVTSYFSHSALEMMIKRLEHITEFDVKHHQEIIKSSFYCGDHDGPEFSYSSIPRTPNKTTDWHGYAKSCAQVVMNQSIVGQDGDRAWVGLDYQPHLGTHMLDVLKPDILSGTCGLSMLFVDLYKAYRNDKYKEIALSSLASTNSIVKNSVDNFSNLSNVWGTSKNPVFMGAYFGIGAQILALEYASSQLQCARSTGYLQQYISAIPLKEIRSFASSDFISGYSGLLFSLIGIKEDSQLAEMTNFQFQEQKMFPENSIELERLPSIEPGMEYFKQILAKTDNEYLIKEPNKAGELFTALEFLHSSMVPKATAKTMDNYLNKLPAKLSTAELIDHAELALNIFTICHDEKYLVIAKNMALEIIFRKNYSGQWFADIWASDTHLLSVVNGIGALSHLFLRLGTLEKIGSFRRLSTFKNIIHESKTN